MIDLRDPVASGTHLLTSVWAVFATILLWKLSRGDKLRNFSMTVFGCSMVVLYAASGLFHGLQLPRENLRLYQKIDQSAIYTLIAGTCTPITLLLLTGWFRLFLFGGIWLMAAAGIFSMWLLPQVPHTVMVSIYLIMGWFGILGMPRYYQLLGWRATRWAFLGTFFYTIGAVFELLRWPTLWPGVIRPHEVLHLCDMAGTGSFFIFVVRYVLPFKRMPLRSPDTSDDKSVQTQAA